MTYYISTRPYRLARRMVDPAEYESLPDFSLAVDVREDNDVYTVNALVPGLKADDLNVQILDDMVTIQGEFKGDDSDYLLRELPHGSFKRTLRMPVSLDPNKTEANITDGVLTLRLMKSESARPRVIKVAAK
jgi:HSP20 family protein